MKSVYIIGQKEFDYVFDLMENQSGQSKRKKCEPTQQLEDANN